MHQALRTTLAGAPADRVSHPLSMGFTWGSLFPSSHPNTCSLHIYLLLVFQMWLLGYHAQLHGTSEILCGGKERHDGSERTLGRRSSAISSVWVPCPDQRQYDPSTWQRMTEGGKGGNTAKMAGAFINWDTSAWWGVVPFQRLMPEPTGEMKITFGSSKT